MAGDDEEVHAEADAIQQQLAEIKDMSMPDLVKTMLKNMRQNEKLSQQNAELIQKLADQAAPAPADVAAQRAEKISKLNLALRKSSKIKDFKDTQETSVKEWIRKYEAEILVLKRMSGINNDLTSDESKLLLKDKLDHHVIKRVDTALRNDNVEFSDLTYDEFTKLLKQEFGGKVADVCDVLMQFGPNRLKKSEEMSVSKFTHMWLDQLPECMTPQDTEEANREFVDLIKRALFYYSLNDPFIQKELCDLEGPQTFKSYFDAAVLAD